MKAVKILAAALFGAFEGNLSDTAVGSLASFGLLAPFGVIALVLGLRSFGRSGLSH